MAILTRKAMEPGDPRLMVQWARRYAKSRTVSFLVQWVFIVLMVLAIATAAALTNMAYTSRQMGLFYGSMVLMGLTCVALAWFSVSRWGSEVVWRITQWLYGREGYVSYADEDDGVTPWWLMALGGGLVIYHLLGALLVSVNYVHLRNLQPFSALYMVPFLCVMIWRQRLGFWAWIWPILYGIHAILLFFDVAEIAFRGQYQLLNLVVPVFGYGLVAILAGHLYSRFALWQLRRLARSGLGPGEEDDAGRALRDEGPE